MMDPGVVVPQVVKAILMTMRSCFSGFAALPLPFLQPNEWISPGEQNGMESKMP